MISTYSDSDYINAFRKHRTLPNAVMSKWLELFNSYLPQSRGTLVDVGCGWGRFAVPIAAHLGNRQSNVLAIDSSLEMINYCKQYANELGLSNLITKNAPVEFFTPENAINIVFFSEALHAMIDLNQLFHQISGWLDPGGAVMIRSPSHLQLRKIEWLHFVPGLLEQDLKRTPDVPQIEKALLSSGFRVESITEFDESYTYFSKEHYLQPLLDRAYSVLRPLDLDSLRQCLLNSVSIDTRKDWVHTFGTTSIIAIKS